jgi:hypothetical protein
MTKITVESIKSLGIDKVARFSACIYVNYLYYMNGGGYGYSDKQIKKIEKRQSDYVYANYDKYVTGVVNTINKTQTDTSGKYFKKEYIKWFS